ncbi:hypothetical protein GHV40_14245 [Devosia sp. D6-9]|nr:hypothetical protein GHV40_14245 [Devosia sp. D6-9]
MARSLSAETLAALAARSLVPRDFLWIVARTRDTGAPVAVGFWSDLQNVTAQVIDPDTDLAVTRTFYGAGGLISISDIPLVSVLTVQNVTIAMSQLNEMVEEAYRLYDIKQARVEIHRGLFDPDSRALVAPAFCRWVGFVDTIQIKLPSENEDGGVTLNCVSHTQEMVRSNPDTRSHESQKLRDPSDDFFIDANVVGEWDHDWGQISGKVETKPSGLFGWGGFLGFL